MKRSLVKMITSLLFISVFSINIYSDTNNPFSRLGYIYNPNDIHIQNAYETDSVYLADEFVNNKKLFYIEHDNIQWIKSLSEKGVLYLIFDLTDSNFLEYDTSFNLKDCSYVRDNILYFDENIFDEIPEFYYGIVLMVEGYYPVLAHNGSAIGNYDKGINVPEDLEVIENVSTGNLEITTTDTKYLELIDDIQLSLSPNDYSSSERFQFYHVGEENKNFDYSYEDNKTKLVIDASKRDLQNTEYNIEITTYQYKPYFGQVEFQKQGTLDCPEFNLYCDEITGDIILHSEDKKWINNVLTDDYTVNANKPRIRFSHNYESVFYSNGINNAYPIQKIDDNTLCINTDYQKNPEFGSYGSSTEVGYLTNGYTYDVEIKAKGYSKSETVQLTIKNASKPLPASIKCYLNDSGLYIFDSDNLDYLKDICYIYIHYIYNQGSFSSLLISEDISNNNSFVHVTKEKFDLAFDSNPNKQYLEGLPKEYNIALVFADGKYTRIEKVLVENEILNCVSFNPNGGLGKMDGIKIDGECNLPNCTYIPPFGKQFVGWKIDNESRLYLPGEIINVAGSKTIKAIWEDKPNSLFDIKDYEIDPDTFVTAYVESNYMLANISFNQSSSLLGITQEEIEKGVVAWIETTKVDTNDDAYLEMSNAVSLETSGTLLSVLDINLFKKVKGENVNQIRDVNGSVSISLYIGDNETLMQYAENGELFMYNIHNGLFSSNKTCVYDKNTKTISFETSEFSIYSLVRIPKTEDKAEKNNLNTRPDYKAPNTGVQ